MANKPVEIRLTLRLMSDTLTPEQMSDELNVPFDRCHRIGEIRGRTDQRWKENWWVITEKLEVDFGEAYDEVVLSLHRLLNRVESCREAFAQLASGERSVLTVVLDSDGYPGMGLDSDILQRLARLGVSLDFDLYFEPHLKAAQNDG